MTKYWILHNGRTRWVEGPDLDERTDSLKPAAAVSITDEPYYATPGTGLASATQQANRAAIQQAIDDMGASGGGGIYVPPGMFEIAQHPTSPSTALYCRHSNITIFGDDSASMLKVVATSGTNPALMMLAGWAKTTGNLNGSGTTGWVNTATYALTGTVAVGATTLTLATPAQAANFAPGDWLYIRTGQLLSALVGQPVAEVLKVKSVNAGTGVITLAEPTTKPYAQEYFVSGTIGLTSTTPTANPAIFGVANVTDRTIENFKVRNCKLIDPYINAMFIGGQCVGLVAEHNWTVGRYQVFGWGAHRDTWIRENRIEIQGSAAEALAESGSGGPVYALAADTGCSRSIFEDNIVTCERVAFIHIHEGPSTVSARRNKFLNTPTSGDEPAVTVRARAFAIDIEDNTFFNTGNTVGIYVDSTCDGGGSIRGNKIYGGNFAFTIAVNAPNWVLDADPPNATLTSIGTTVPKTPLKMEQLCGWLADNQTSITLGDLPRDCFVTKVHVWVSEAFNSSGTDVLDVGFGAFPNVFAAGVDVSTTGLKTPAAGSNLGWQFSLVRTVTATYTAGGGAPTTGKALVIVEFCRAPSEIA